TAVRDQPGVEALHAVPREAVEVIANGMKRIAPRCLSDHPEEEVSLRQQSVALVDGEPELVQDCIIDDGMLDHAVDQHLIVERIVADADAEQLHGPANVALALAEASVLVELEPLRAALLVELAPGLLQLGLDGPDAVTGRLLELPYQPLLFDRIDVS